MTNPEDIGRTDSPASGFEQSSEAFDPRTDDFPTKDRKYIHFDYALSKAQREELSLDTISLGTHDFWPLLGFTIEERRKAFDENGNEAGFKLKPRDIKFGSHLDAAILELYGRRLSSSYEEKLRQRRLGRCVLAYRSGIGDNILQAKGFFDLISANPNCTAIAFDISKFFDRIDHRVLKDSLREVLGTPSLSRSDYHVFKTMTRFSWVDKDKLQARLEGVKKLPHGRICYPKTFEERIRKPSPKIIEVNEGGCGIPQGSPLSGLYANISLLEFDQECLDYFSNIGGFYRRYSDDIAVLVPNGQSHELACDFIRKALVQMGLQLNDSKTNISVFTESEGEVVCDEAFQYLGFLFDGRRVLIRPSSIQRYYKKMRQGIRSKILAAKKKNVPHSEIYLRELYRKYTHYGRVRNFPRYAYRASYVFESPEIKRQISSHVSKFRGYLNEAINKYY